MSGRIIFSDKLGDDGVVSLVESSRLRCHCKVSESELDPWVALTV